MHSCSVKLMKENQIVFITFILISLLSYIYSDAEIITEKKPSHNFLDSQNYERIYNFSSSSGWKKPISISYQSSANFYSREFESTFNVLGYNEFATYKVQFLNYEESQHFEYDLIKNLKGFLNEFYTPNLLDLRHNAAYKDKINKNYKKRTIIIGIDGLAPVCAQLEFFESFSYMMTYGSYSMQMRTSTEGMSGPSWTNIFYSMRSKDTGIVDNSWEAPWISENNRDKYQYHTPVTGLDTPLPSIFQIMKEKINSTNFFISSWNFFEENFSNKAVSNTIDIFSDCQITNHSMFNLTEYSACDSHSLLQAESLVLKDFDLLFWYFSSADISGHVYNWCSHGYFNTLKNIDSILMTFFDYLWKLNLLDKINIILTSDHGSDRNRYFHGRDKYDGNLFVPIYLMGPDFKANYEIKNPIHLIDIAPTIALINKILPSEYWKGKPLIETLKTYDNNLLVNSIFIEFSQSKNISFRNKLEMFNLLLVVFLLF